MPLARSRRPIIIRRLKRDFLILLLFLLLAAVYSWFHPQGEPETVAGGFRAVDGDTLTIEGMRIRIRGIDAPERRQLCGAGSSRWPCGLAAGRALAARLPGLSCRLEGRDKYRRRLATCTMPSGDLGAEMVRNGFAVAYGSYQREEAEARAAGRGIWSGPFERPEDWRKAHRPRAAQADQSGPLDLLGRWWYGTGEGKEETEDEAL